MDDRNDDEGGEGHADSPRKDTPAHTAGRPDGAPVAPGELHRDGPLPTTGRQPQRPGQDGRYERRPGGRDPETLKPSDE